jgi:hypothetical protein
MQYEDNIDFVRGVGAARAVNVAEVPMTLILKIANKMSLKHSTIHGSVCAWSKCRVCFLDESIALLRQGGRCQRARMKPAPTRS